uniref:ADAM_spacer1 domain-containing protein n=1 Tax=Strongyloides papillosus TaxID=174720 RepID=A0A0N5CGW9_STREA
MITLKSSALILIIVCGIGNIFIEGVGGRGRRNKDNGDDLYILLDEANVFRCRGVNNLITINESDINILNDKGNRVYYIKAPGDYSFNFGKINVLDNLGHLTGELGITLQVPLLDGPAGIRFDVPYTMVPETGLLNQECDEHSGIVERDGRQYCRYCELCSISSKVESALKNNKLLPGLAKGEEKAFGPKCGKIGSNTYDFRRTLHVPGRKELEKKIKEKIQGVDAEVRKRLNKGRGRFQVFLNLISADQPPISQKAWFDGSDQCRGCGPGNRGKGNPALSFLYCNTEDCKSAWAQQCLHNSAKIAACITVEFNYRITTKYSEVLQFLRENNYPNQDTATPQPTTEPPHEEPAPDASQSSLENLSERCVAKMATRLTHLRRYCTIFWNEKLCCQHCEGVC